MGESGANRLRDFAREAFVRAIAPVINILDPDKIVLGGGVSNLDWFYDEDIFLGSHEVFNTSVRNAIVRHELGDSAGVFGAALLVAKTERDE
jgi:predicted NBD/HSP70 family sugar kinase